MDSDDRSFSIVAGFVCAMIVALVFMVSSCVVQETRLNAPAAAAKAKSAHLQRMKCIEMRGSWTDNRYSENSCNFPK